MIFIVPTIAHCETCAVDRKFNVLPAEKIDAEPHGRKRQVSQILSKFQMLENKSRV